MDAVVSLIFRETTASIVTVSKVDHQDKKTFLIRD